VAGVAVSLACCLAVVVAATVACVAYRVVQGFVASAVPGLRVPEAPRGTPDEMLGAPEATRGDSGDSDIPKVDPDIPEADALVDERAVLREKFKKLTIKQLIVELAAQGCTHDAEGREYRVNTAHSRKGALVEAMVGLVP
jgi:hypothetical protein